MNVDSAQNSNLESYVEFSPLFLGPTPKRKTRTKNKNLATTDMKRRKKEENVGVNLISFSKDALVKVDTLDSGCSDLRQDVLQYNIYAPAAATGDWSRRQQ